MTKFIASIFFIFCAVTASVAQTDAEKTLVDRANRLLDSSMSAINLRAQRFNEEIKKVNQLNPLDSTSLTPEKIKSNRAALKDFFNYLEVYRSLSGKFLKDVDDTIVTIRGNAPHSHREVYLMEFQQAVHKDQEAFDKFTLALSSFWKKIDEVLGFISTASVELQGGKLQFKAEEDLKKYQAFMAEATKLNKKASLAATASVKAAADASQAMNEAYGIGPKK